MRTDFAILRRDKQMKKFLSLALTLALVFSLFIPAPANAADPVGQVGLSMSATPTVVSPGDTFTVSLDITSVPAQNISSFNVTLAFDKNVLTVENPDDDIVVNGAISKKPDISSGFPLSVKNLVTIAYVDNTGGNNPISGPANIATIKFKVLSTAAAGSTTIKLAADAATASPAAVTSFASLISGNTQALGFNAPTASVNVFLPATLSGVTDGSVYNAPQTITLQNVQSATLDGSAFTSGSTVSAEGDHTLVYTDFNNASKTVHFAIDTTAPTVTGVSEGGLYKSVPSLTFSDSHFKTATLDGTAFTSGSSVTKDGSHTLVVTDAAGNTTTVHFTVDGTAPAVSGVTDGAFYKDASKTITITDASTVTATLNGPPFTSGGTVSAEGTYTLVATDAAGNATTVHFTIDRTAPVITVGSYTTTPTNGNITVTAQTNEGTLNAASHTFTANGSFTFTATDAAGNTTNKTVTITNIDKTAPVVTGVTEGKASKDSLTIAIADDNTVTATLNGTPFTSGATVSAEGTYTLVATDAAGNVTTVHFTIDKTAPVISDTPDNDIANIQAAPTFNEGTATLNGKAYVSGTPITEAGVYTLIVTDAAGNTTQASFTLTGMVKGYQMVDSIITGVSPETTVADFLTHIGLASGSAATVKNAKGDTLSATDKVGTGATMTVSVSGVDTFDYEVILFGDINGDGYIDATDLLLVKRAMLGMTQLDGFFAIAADVNQDGETNASDLLLLKRSILGLQTISQQLMIG